jgi:sporulation protein YlmC with PRC-barrel domain
LLTPRRTSAGYDYDHARGEPVKRIEELLGMPIVTLEEGTRLGRLKGVEVDTIDGRIRYLRLDGEGHRAEAVIPWDAVRAIGGDAITVESKDSVKETVLAADRDRLSSYVGDRPVVTESGNRLGTVTSYEVDERNGVIGAYHVAAGGIFGRLTGNEIVFPHAAVRTFGKDAIIVADEVSRRKAA